MHKTAVGLRALAEHAGATQASVFVQTDLVSDISGFATITDPNFVNSWGMSETATSPIWVSDQGTHSATLYSITGGTNVTKVIINPPSGFVAIPATGTGPQGPTGQVSNSNAASFQVGNGGNGGAAHFVFANLDGTISAWDVGPTSFVQATTPGAAYTGLAINAARSRIYAANSAGSGGIDVFDSTFASVTLPGGFRSKSSRRLRSVQCSGHRRQNLCDPRASGACGANRGHARTRRCGCV